MFYCRIGRVACANPLPIRYWVRILNTNYPDFTEGIFQYPVMAPVPALDRLSGAVFAFLVQ